jgi:hypothetical protein
VFWKRYDNVWWPYAPPGYRAHNPEPVEPKRKRLKSYPTEPLEPLLDTIPASVDIPIVNQTTRPEASEEVPALLNTSDMDNPPLLDSPTADTSNGPLANQDNLNI